MTAFARVLDGVLAQLQEHQAKTEQEKHEIQVVREFLSEHRAAGYVGVIVAASAVLAIDPQTALQVAGMAKIAGQYVEQASQEAA